MAKRRNLNIAAPEIEGRGLRVFGHLRQSLEARREAAAVRHPAYRYRYRHGFHPAYFCVIPGRSGFGRLVERRWERRTWRQRRQAVRVSV